MTPFRDKLFEDKPEPAKRPKGPAERIYAAYPKHVGRVAAIKAINKALKSKVITYQALMAATEEYAESVRHIRRGSADWHIVPHGATWYNDQRWSDDPRDRPTYQSRTYQPGNPTDEQSREDKRQRDAEAQNRQRTKEDVAAYVATLSPEEYQRERDAALAAIDKNNHFVRGYMERNKSHMDWHIWTRRKQENEDEQATV